MPKPARAYPVRLAGTRGYQAAIAAAAPGDPVQLLCETGNPFDADAIAVTDARGATLGYIPRDSWVQRAVAREGKGATASIETLSTGADAITGVTIAVTLTDDGAIGARDYAPA